MIRPRYASTIVLVRPADQGGFDVLLTRRPEAMRFLGGFYVFPGGAVHAADCAQSILQRCHGLSGAEAQRLLDMEHQPAEALGHWVAVVRELFEEVGILLCVDEKGDPVASGEPAAADGRIERARQAIVQKKLDFGDFVRGENLFCDLSRIMYFDHWVTPAIYSMRFDTRFYIAPLPRNQTALARSEEVTHSLWIAPDEALARMDRRNFPILPPTTTVLDRLARLATWKRLAGEFGLN
jgi:8-oxo-dGTP pyrophosphatase MutT (NUDIX family)